ncbi:MAG: hypothetical protein QGG42_11735 [Phycisphaerae bacterium]|jgi:hypothetical protein|nr:hypothetical protein [Phycisphaerae bacterium]
MRKAVIIVLSALVSLGFASKLVAEVRNPQAGGAICDRKFDVLSQKDRSKLGAYSIKAVGSKDKKRIVITETMTLSVRGKTFAYKSTLVCADKDGVSPLEGSVETRLGDKICMTGTVKFSPTGRTFDYECTGRLNAKTGQALNPAKKYDKKGRAAPAGMLVFQSAVPSIGPRILPAEGELEDIVLVEFPDDVAAPEIINFKTGNRLVRSKPDAGGGYEIQLFGPRSKNTIASYRFDKNNQVVSMELFGKFSLRPVAKAKGKDAIEVTVTPGKPYLLADKSTKLLIKKETLYENRKRLGVPQLTHKDMTLDIAPNTVIASGGWVFHLSTPHDYKFGHVRESDMIFTVVDSCKFSVRSEKAKPPVVELKKLQGSLNFACDNRQSSQLKNISGAGKHFIGLRVGRTEIYRRHPSKVLGTGMDVLVVNNFGAKRIRLEYMQKKVVTIGPETITIESFNFKYATKSVEIKVSAASKTAKAKALIVEYSDVTRKE